MTNVMETAKSSTRDAASWSAARSPLVPHVAFWSMSFLFKVLFPGALKWLAYDNITTLLLSVWYPLCATIALIHRDKGRQQLQNDDALDSLQTERQFWIEYWSVGFAGVQFLHRFVSLVPSSQQMGHQAYPQLPVILKEIKLLYFLWIFVMETLLARYQRFLGVDEQKAHWKKFVPLTFLTKVIGPRLMRVQIAVSEQISKETWQRYIKRKAQKVLELMVMLQFLEVESMDYLLQLLEDGRSLFPLSICMVLPSSISDVGMLYPQFIYPSARSLVARGDTLEILSLKFWVLNNILSLFLSATWWFWWCIPFSNQLLLGIRCFATFPSTITYYYQMLEMDLITFGILTGEPKMTVKDTKTVQALRALVKRLPRDKHAQSFQFEIDEQKMKIKHDDDDSSIGSEDTTESEQERRRKRRHQKRAKKKLLKQKKKSGSSTNSNSGRPPVMLSEGFVARYISDEEREKYGQQKNDTPSDDEANYSSFINTNESQSNQYSLRSTEHNAQQKNNKVGGANGDNSSYMDENEHYKSKSNEENIVPNLPPKAKQNSFCITEKEQRDSRNAAAKDSASQAEIRHTTSFSTTNDDCNEDNRNNTLSHSMEKDKSKAKVISNSVSDDANDRALLSSMTIGSNYSFSQLQSDSRLTSLSIATPTESVDDEVEVRVKLASGRSKPSTRSKTAATTIFPATYPTLSGSGLIPPLASNEELSTKSSMTSLNILSSMSQPQLSDNENNNDADSGLCLSDIDTAASSTIGVNESFEAWSPSSYADKKTSLKEQQQYDDENGTAVTTDESNTTESATETTDGKSDPGAEELSVIHAPTRRSSRLNKLREWQDQKREEEDLAPKKKQKAVTAKPSKKQKPKTSDIRSMEKSDVEKKAKKSTKISAEKAKKSKSSSTDKKEKSTATSPKRTSKKSRKTSSEIDSDLSKPTAASLAKRVKKKSSAASPEKSAREHEGEAPSEDNIDVADRSSSSSPGKTSRKKSKKVPNSRRKKTMFGGVLGRS